MLLHMGSSSRSYTHYLTERMRSQESVLCIFPSHHLSDYSLCCFLLQPGSSLEQTHIFVLAHILRRPIIVYGVKYYKSFRGETLGYTRFQGEHVFPGASMFLLDIVQMWHHSSEPGRMRLLFIRLPTSA